MFVTLKQLSQVFQVSSRGLNYRIDKRAIPSYYFGERVLRLKLEDFVMYGIDPGSRTVDEFIDSALKVYEGFFILFPEQRRMVESDLEQQMRDYAERNGYFSKRKGAASSKR
jgi:hypothetical protein